MVSTIARPRLDSIPVGSRVRAVFAGSKSLGNDPYELTLTVLSRSGVGDARRVQFSYDDSSDMSFEVYRYNGHWAYGTSAETFRILEVI